MTIASRREQVREPFRQVNRIITHLDLRLLPLLKMTLLFFLLLVAAFAPEWSANASNQSLPLGIDSTLTRSLSHVLGAWNSITIDGASVHSRRGGQLNRDCTRLGTTQSEVECFSIQQNFWISNSMGSMVFWIQNVVQLAELEEGVFFATYAFLVWNSTDGLQPRFCDPFSLSDSVCRAPIYMDPARLPQSFAFYADISSVGANYTLRVSNDFASRSWNIPGSAGCPCFIETLRQKPPPWGYFPFEFVMVGLDNSATAFFTEGTSGSVSPGMVQFVDGDWHQASLSTLYCDMPIDCSTPPSTGEISVNLRWDNRTGRFYWSSGARDQGVYVATISPQPAEPPPIPYPAVESYLYIRMGLRDLAVPTVFDDQSRATGYDSTSGGFVQNIPRSFLTLSGEIGIIILNPSGSYRVTLTPLGSGPYHLLMSKESNINGTRSSRLLDGTIYALEPKQFVLDSNKMTLISEGNYEPSLIMLGLGLVWVTIIVGILLWRRKRQHSSRDSYDNP